MPREADERRIWKLHTQGLSQREIARQTKISRTRVQDILKRLPQGSAQVTPSTSPSVDTPPVHRDISEPLSESPQLQELVAMWPDLTAMVGEWRARKAVRREQGDASRETRLKTYHVEKRHIERIAAYAKEAGLSQSEVLNEAIRQFFEGR
jgi:DNA-binding transcriptional regulator LsrR (DeoR family)